MPLVERRPYISRHSVSGLQVRERCKRVIAGKQGRNSNGGKIKAVSCDRFSVAGDIWTVFMIRNTISTQLQKNHDYWYVAYPLDLGRLLIFYSSQTYLRPRTHSYTPHMIDRSNKYGRQGERRHNEARHITRDSCPLIRSSNFGKIPMLFASVS